MQQSFDIDELVHFLAGEGSPAERRQVEQWISASPDNEALFLELRRVWTVAALESAKGDVERLWESMKGRIEQHERLKINLSGRKATERPGRALVREVGRDGRLERERPSRPPSGAGWRKPRRTTRWGQAAGTLAVVLIVAVAIVGGQELLAPEQEAVPEVAMRTISTEPGQRATVTLRDGTEVYLNAASTLTLPESFSPHRREVHLDGEAFFKVVRDEERPFVLNAGGASVQVLGTTFNVQAYADELQVEVVVQEGRVAVRPEAAEEGAGSVLEAGQMTSVRGASLQPVMLVDVDRYLAWRSGQLVFEKSSFEEVSRALSRWYGLDVHLGASTPVTGRLTATFTEESLSEILGVIATALRLDFDRQGKRVVFSPARPG